MNLKNKKILITSGPTWVKIDSMRVISNQSSGEMGTLLVDAFVKKGARVTLIQGPTLNGSTNNGAKIYSFKFFGELLKIVKTTLSQPFDIIIHAAAVSDFKPKKISTSKISSSTKKLQLELVPTQKIIDIFKRKQPKTLLVGFKLETTLTKATQASKKLFDQAKCDFVIANTQQKNNYSGAVLTKNSQTKVYKTKQSIVNALIKQIEDER